MKIIIKIGTSTLTYVSGCINIRRIESLCKVISDLKNAGNEVIMVSSGAIAMGHGKLNIKSPPQNPNRILQRARGGNVRATPRKCVVGLQPLFSVGNALFFLDIHKVCLRKTAFFRRKISG